MGTTVWVARAAATNLAVDPVNGYWQTENGEGTVEIYDCGERVCGRFHWLNKDSLDDVSRDIKNPDPDKRDRPLCKMQFMGGFSQVSPGHYEGGWIYSPRSGSTYSARLTMIDHDTLDLHGYVLTPLLGESQTWKRVSPDPVCTTEKL